MLPFFLATDLWSQARPDNNSSAEQDQLKQAKQFAVVLSLSFLRWEKLETTAVSHGVPQASATTAWKR